MLTVGVGGGAGREGFGVAAFFDRGLPGFFFWFFGFLNRIDLPCVLASPDINHAYSRESIES